MQSRFGSFSISALNKMRALMLIFLTCCVYLEIVSGLKSSTKGATQGLTKFQPSDINRDGGSVLDIRGGVNMSCVRLRCHWTLRNDQLSNDLLQASDNAKVHLKDIDFITKSSGEHDPRDTRNLNSPSFSSSSRCNIDWSSHSIYWNPTICRENISSGICHQNLTFIENIFCSFIRDEKELGYVYLWQFQTWINAFRLGLCTKGFLIIFVHRIQHLCCIFFLCIFKILDLFSTYPKHAHFARRTMSLYNLMKMKIDNILYTCFIFSGMYADSSVFTSSIW